MQRLLLRPTRAAVMLFALALTPAPAGAAVTMTFWSHDFGKHFPHALISLRGTPDAGGAAVDRVLGFTARSLSPAILLGTVRGRVESPDRGYMDQSVAQFSVVLDDARYARVVALAAAWDEATGDARYNLKSRNCVHFVREAARIAGLAGLDQPRLMKKPRSYLQAVAAANPGRITIVAMRGDAYLASLPPLAPADPPYPRTISITSSVDWNPGNGSTSRQRAGPMRSTSPAMSRRLSRP